MRLLGVMTMVSLVAALESFIFAVLGEWPPLHGWMAIGSFVGLALIGGVAHARLSA